jgi:xanthine/uracil permease
LYRYAAVSGIISSIPDCVIGGMTTFLFCNVFVSGLKVGLNSVVTHSA